MQEMLVQAAAMARSQKSCVNCTSKLALIVIHLPRYQYSSYTTHSTIRAYGKRTRGGEKIYNENRNAFFLETLNSELDIYSFSP